MILTEEWQKIVNDIHNQGFERVHFTFLKSGTWIMTVDKVL